MPLDIQTLVVLHGTGEDDVDVVVLEHAVAEAVEAARQDSAPPDDVVAVRDETSYGVEILVTDDDQIRELNRDYRGVDLPTDVLSFSFVADVEGAVPQAFPGVPVQLGQLVLSLPYAVRQAADLGHGLSMELAWLTIHGTLQLLGYGHAEEEEAQHMEALEDHALRALGFSRQ